MAWPEPKPGLVIRYAYLWDRESQTGRDGGVKDRPCAVVLAHTDANGRRRVYVLPITHSDPGSDDAVEIPPKVKNHLGLDSGRSWIMLTEVNVFNWPGPDLRPVPGRGQFSAAYGYLPPRFLQMVRDRFLELRQRHRTGFVTRTE